MESMFPAFVRDASGAARQHFFSIFEEFSGNGVGVVRVDATQKVVLRVLFEYFWSMVGGSVQRPACQRTRFAYLLRILPQPLAPSAGVFVARIGVVGGAIQKRPLAVAARLVLLDAQAVQLLHLVGLIARGPLAPHLAQGRHEL